MAAVVMEKAAVATEEAVEAMEAVAMAAGDTVVVAMAAAEKEAVATETAKAAVVMAMVDSAEGGGMFGAPAGTTGG